VKPAKVGFGGVFVMTVSGGRIVRVLVHVAGVVRVRVPDGVRYRGVLREDEQQREYERKERSLDHPR
jgi:hypothetical protein